MTTKPKEFTNEDVARALGWEYFKHESYAPDSGWFLGGKRVFYTTPDFKNDLNASWKYVWPEIMELANKKYKGNHTWRIDFLKELLLRAFESKNPALYLAEKLIELKGEKS